MADPKPGSIVHVELTSNDPPASQKFLEALFGWKFKKEQMGGGEDYWTFQAGSGPGGGMMKPMGEMPCGTLNYVLVDSIEASVKKVKKLGGTIMMDRTEIPKVGWFAIYMVPGGFVQAIYEPLPKS